MVAMEDPNNGSNDSYRCDEDSNNTAVNPEPLVEMIFVPGGGLADGCGGGRRLLGSWCVMVPRSLLSETAKMGALNIDLAIPAFVICP
jgi:hypothetical protein